MEPKIPQNIEAEQAVLGSVFVEQGSMKTIIDKLQRHDFYSPNNQVVFQAMCDLYKDGFVIDYTTLADRLESKNELVKAGGIEYIVDLVNAVASSANLIYYIDIVKDKSVVRKIQDKCRQIIERSYQVEDAPAFVDDVEREVFDITRDKRTSDFRNIGEVAEILVEDIVKHKQSGVELTGLDTKYYELNRLTLGLQPTELFIVAARPSVGKTAFALNLALNVARNPEHPHVAIFSLEMGVEQLVLRLLSCQSQVDNERLKKGALSSQDVEKLNYATDQLLGLNMYIDDSGTVKVQDLRSKCRKLKQDNKLDLVIIDYLQLLSGSGVYAGNRVQEVSEISRVLKEMARELKVPVVALSQLSRKSEERDQPIMADLRESGSIEQDADLVMFLHPEKKEDEIQSNQLKMIVAKNRSGRIGDFHLYFNKAKSTFSNPTGKADETEERKQSRGEY